MVTTIYLIRHAEAEGNLLNLFLGQKDDKVHAALTQKGREQAAMSSEQLKEVHFDAIYSSDLLRTQQTAEILRGHRDIEIKLEPLLRERTWGNFELQPRDKVKKENPELFKKYDRLDFAGQWSYRFDGSVESYEDLDKRFEQVLQRILQEQEGKTVMVVTHSAVMRSFLTKIDRKYFLREVNYVAMAKILADQGRFKILETRNIG